MAELPPRATLRLQLHAGFGFDDAAALLPYFESLGVSHLYLSPIMTARKGSLHGYDVIDPTKVNPELGGEAGLKALSVALHARGMGLIVDVVPNHMAAVPENRWWWDVLKYGRLSAHADFFDIDWDSPDPLLRGKILLPILGRPYGAALADIDRVGNELHYFGHRAPLSPPTRGETKLAALISAQHYRLAWWRCANDEINWRRFFDINELVALRMDVPSVFDAVHETLLRLCAEGVIEGLRIDHIDGLADPGAYCRKLRERFGGYLVVEKILGPKERLDPEWRCDGTSGYDFMNQASLFLHDASGEQALTRSWSGISGRSGDFAHEEDLARREILTRNFAAPLEAAARELYRVLRGDPMTRDASKAAIRRILIEVIAALRVYRLYPDRPFDMDLLARTRAGCAPNDRPVLDMLVPHLPGCLKLHQLAASIAAKAVEDTALYRYGRLLSRNDVGFDLSRFSLSADDFHAAMRVRRAETPSGLLATATHDHKRGEDVRARLAVLSEIPERWIEAVSRWVASGQGLDPGHLDMVFQTLVGAFPFEGADDEFIGRIARWQEKALREGKLLSDWSAPDEAYEASARGFLTTLRERPIWPEIEAFARAIDSTGAANGLIQTTLKLTAPGVPDLYQGTEYWDLSLVDPDNRRAVDFRARAESAGNSDLPGMALDWRNGAIKQFVVRRLLHLRRQARAVFTDGDYFPLKVDGACRHHVFAFARTCAEAYAITIVGRHLHSFLDNSLAIPAHHWEDTRIVTPFQACFEDVLTGTRIDGPQFELARVLIQLPIAVFHSSSRVVRI